MLRLIGAGSSNPEIADELVISLATVKSHVRHILAKLALRDRVQAVVLRTSADSRAASRPSQASRWSRARPPTRTAGR